MHTSVGTGRDTLLRMVGWPSGPAAREALGSGSIGHCSLTSSAQLPQAGPEGSLAQRVLTQGARQLLKFGRLDLADELERIFPDVHSRAA